MNANAAPVSFLPDFLNILSGLVARVRGFFSPRQSATVNTADDHAAATVDAPEERAAALDADAEYDAAMKTREAEKSELDFLADIAPRFNYRLNERRAALVDASEDYEAALYLNSRLPLARRLKVMHALYLAERFNHKAYGWVKQREFEAWISGYSAEVLTELYQGENTRSLEEYRETTAYEVFRDAISLKELRAEIERCKSLEDSDVPSYAAHRFRAFTHSCHIFADGNWIEMRRREMGCRAVADFHIANRNLLLRLESEDGGESRIHIWDDMCDACLPARAAA